MRNQPPAPPAEHARRMAAYIAGIARGVKLSTIARDLRLNESTFRKWVERHVGGYVAYEASPKARAKGTERKCMTCGVAFVSTGPHHRLCKYHRQFAADASPYMPDQGGDTGRQRRAVRS